MDLQPKGKHAVATGGCRGIGQTDGDAITAARRAAFTTEEPVS